MAMKQVVERGDLMFSSSALQEAVIWPSNANAVQVHPCNLEELTMMVQVRYFHVWSRTKGKLRKLTTGCDDCFAVHVTCHRHPSPIGRVLPSLLTLRTVFECILIVWANVFLPACFL